MCLLLSPFSFFSTKLPLKGPDTTKFQIQADGDKPQPVNEIEDFWKGRYLSTTEAAWRILGFHITKKRPAVTALPIHLPNSTHRHQYQRKDGNASNLSLLDRYFLRPSGEFILDNTSRSFASVTYREYYSYFRLVKYDINNTSEPGYFSEVINCQNSPRMHAILRSPANPHLTRIHHLRPSHGDVFYLRSILLNRPASSFQDARTVNQVVHNTYQAAAKQEGLFTDTSESTQTLLEAVAYHRTPRQLRWLFADLLANDCIEYPLSSWQEFESHLSYDFLLRHSNVTSIADTLALQEIQTFLTDRGKSLDCYGLPEPEFSQAESMAELERWAAVGDNLFERAQTTYQTLNNQQQEVFDMIWNAIQEESQRLLFLDGEAGTGKTTVVKTLCDAIRSVGKIVLATATSGFAAQLYPGGRTTHSMFKVRNVLFTLSHHLF